MIDWIYRNWLVVVLCTLSLVFIGFQRELIRTIVVCVAVGTAAVIFSGIAQYAYTRLNFISQGDSDALSRIFQSICILFGLVVCGYYIAQFS